MSIFRVVIQTIRDDLAFKINTENLKIRSGQLNARLRMYPLILLSQALLEALFVFLYWGHTDHFSLLLWLFAIYSIHSVEILIWIRNHRAPINTILDCIRWKNYFNLFVTFVALAWGAIPFLFFPPDLGYQALMISILLGLAAAAVTLDATYPPALYIFVLGTTLPLFARLMLEGSEVHYILASMILIFLIAALTASYELSKTFWLSLWQRHENDLLVEQLTKQKSMAETANGDKSRFLASASHDLRQPLQALVLFSESLQEVAENNESRHLAGQIGKSVHVLVDMFDELLDISKFDAGVVQVDKKNFKVQNILNRLDVEFTPLAVSKGLEFSIPKTDAFGFSDPVLLERILRNLISNAIRYTDYGRIKVSCEPVGQMLQFEVKDTGIGIHAKNIPLIFDEYFQVENQQRDRLKGLGLGLSIVRRMETLLGCHVSVVSKPALGSVFSLSIPQGTATANDLPAVTSQSKHDLNGIIVALIDDEPDIRHMVAKLLRQWGCEVYAGELPSDVLNQMTEEGISPDIMICDYRLPGGLTAIDGIKKMQQLWPAHIPTVVLTGDTGTQTLKDIKASGAVLLHKPIAPARLRSIIYFALHNENSRMADLP